MSRLITRRAFAGAAGGAGILALAACGGGAQTPPGSAQGPKVDRISVVTWASQGNNVTVEAGQRFTTKTRIQVDVENVSGVGDEYLTAMTARLASDTAPDAYWNSSTTGLTLAKGGAVEALDKYLSREQVKWADLVPMAQTSVQFTGDGATWALPIATWTTNLWYNKELFRQAGVAAPTDNWTLEGDFFEAARKLTRGVTAEGAAEVWGTTAPNASHLAMQYALAFGGQILANDLKSVALNGTAAQKGLQWNLDLADKHKVAPRPGQAASFVQRQVAMLIDGPHQLKPLRDSWEPDHIGVALVPRGPAARVSYGDTRNFSIPARSRAKDEAFKFLVSLLSPEMQLLMGELQVWTPVLKPGKLADWRFGPQGPPANVGDMVRELEWARIWSRPAEVDLRNLFQAEYTKAFRGETNVQNALANVKSQGDVLVRDWWAARK